MTRIFFDRELDSIATIWRVYRSDGVTIAFTSHDRDLVFDGIRHQAAPGMVPAAIRLTADLSDDSAEINGVLSHDNIRAEDLAGGLYDNAAVEVGAVDWKTLEKQIVYSGKMGQVEDNKRGFSAELRSEKSVLELDLVPRTSPTCRAEFCGPRCGLSAPRFTSIHTLSAIDLETNRIAFQGIDITKYSDGQVRFLSGPQTGLVFGVLSADDANLVLDKPLAAGIAIGTITELREGCDHTHTTCLEHFGNILNFRGEPHLPGNDLLTRYG